MALTYDTGAKGSRGRKVSDQYADMLRGFDELIAEMEEYVKGTDEAHRKAALAAGGEMLMNKARQLAPRNTGLLQDKGVVFGQLTSEKVDIGWTEKAFYGRFQEMGRHKMDPRPHVRPAWEQKKNEIFNEMLTVMKLK